VKILASKDAEEVPPLCEQIFLGKEKECFSPGELTLFGNTWTFYTLPFKSPLSMIALSAVRNRQNEVYSVNSSC
jgi:hypothetical protein